jgi:3-oxoacyl-[acyl-carrier protein] reductase
MITLEGKVALVSGGSRGIGAASALLLARAGADVIITYENNKKAASRVVLQIAGLGRRALALRAKVQDIAQSRRVVKTVILRFGKVDILVNSAGIWEEGKIWKMSEKEWDRTIRINLNGVFNMCSAAVPSMMRNKTGRIINISSTAGQRGEAFHSHYAASKGAVIAFTKSIAVELIKYGIWVNCVAPGWVDTEMVSPALKGPEAKKEILRSIPRGVLGTPEEIAGCVLFLASELSNNVVGEILNANGGGVLCG